MTHFFYSSRLAWPPIALLALTATAVYAQPGASAPPPPSVTQSAAPPAFTSALDSYQPYTEEKTANWKLANDTTARIGGWRAYAKEATEPNPTVVPASTPTPSKP